MESNRSISSLIFQYINNTKLLDVITRKDLYKYINDNGCVCYGRTTIDTIRRVYTWNGILSDTNKAGIYIKSKHIPKGVTYGKLLNAYKSHIPISIGQSLLDDIEQSL